MKARIIKTGEEITIIGISKEWGTAQYYGSDGIYHQKTFSNNEIEFLDITEQQPVDWEQRRYEIAKDAMKGILSNEDQCAYASSEAHYEEGETHTIPKAISRYAVALADTLIEELKKNWFPVRLDSLKLELSDKISNPRELSDIEK